MVAGATQTTGSPWEKWRRPEIRESAPASGARALSPFSDELQITATCPLCRGAGFLRVQGAVAGSGELRRCACKEGESRARIWSRARQQSGLPEEAEGTTFDTYRQERQPLAYTATREFVEQPELQWLVLRGGVGTGKTHLLIAAAVALLETRKPLYFVAPDLMDYLRAGMEEIDDRNETTTARTRHLKQADILLIDDLGAENATKWTDERLYQIIDHRYRYRLPLVVATNLSEAAMPPRLASRLHDAARARVITMEPGDYRRSDERADELAELLDQIDRLPRLSAAAD